MTQLDLLSQLITTRSHMLDDLNQLINWPKLSNILSKTRKSLGRTGYPPILLFKCLLLQKLYNASDVELEDSLHDRLSFRRFTGIGLDEKVPDATTLCRFRTTLCAKNLINKLFNQVMQDIESQGYLVKSGTLLDASIIKSRPQDDEGTWTKKNNTYTKGYKIHVGVDAKSELVRSVCVTPANVHDSQKAIDLITDDVAMVYADKGYDSQKIRNHLQLRGISDGIMRRTYHAKFKSRTALRNKALSGVRSGVERAFATLKNHYDCSRSQYVGLVKNTQNFILKIIAMNLKRTLKLKVQLSNLAG